MQTFGTSLPDFEHLVADGEGILIRDIARAIRAEVGEIEFRVVFGFIRNGGKRAVRLVRVSPDLVEVGFEVFRLKLVVDQL